MECTSSNTGGFTLEYWETAGDNANTFQPLNFTDNVAWYGPTSGFPLIDGDSYFRVTWHTSDTYNFTLRVYEVDSSGTPQGDPLASTNVTVNVISGEPINLSWSTEPPASISVGESFTSAVAAELAGGVTSVDNCLFVIEVTKDGAAADPGDFTITSVTGHESTEGINDTFTQVGDCLQGYWGPSDGFPFTGTATTEMTAVFNNPGNYNVTIYAIQVAPADKLTQ